MNYNEMKTKDLRLMARDLGIKGYGSAGKSFLIPEIEKVMAEREAERLAKEEAEKAAKAEKPEKASRKAKTYNGKTLTEWSKELNIPVATLRARMNRGWSLEETFRNDNHNAKAEKLYEYNGKKQSLPAWARELGVSVHTLNARINRLGWTVEKALGTAPKEKTFSYYMIHRPAGPGAQPKEGLVEIENFDKRTFMEAIDREAWATIKYNRKLTEKEIRDYELVQA